MYKFGTRELVATALGAALFFVLFSYVKIPSFIPNTSIHTAYGVAAFFAVVFGPISGGIIGLFGHFLSDTILWGGAWWSWVIASGFAIFITGLCWRKINIEDGEFGKKEIIIFNVFQAIGHIVAWLLIAPVLDIIIYAEPASKVFAQGVFASISNAISCGVIGTLILLAYVRTRVKAGSLS